MDNKNNSAMMGVGLVAGLALGLAIGMLYAPRTGKETRAMLKEHAMDVKEKAVEMAGDMKERAGSMVQMAKERMHAGDGSM